MAVFVWGSNKFGQLSQPTQGGCFCAPIRLEAAEGAQIHAVGSGEGHTVLVSEFGDVMTVGRGREGQLGNSLTGSDADSSVLQYVNSLKGETIIDVACGAHNSICVSLSGRVYIWGLIHQDVDPETLRGAMGETEMATDLTMLEGERGIILNRVVAKSRQAWEMAHSEGYTDLEDLSEAARHCLFKTKEELKAEYQGIMKVSTIRCPHPEPWQCLSLRGVRIKSVAAGFGHCMALSAEGRLYAYGYNDKGQLGLGHRINTSNFLPVESLDGRVVTKVVCGQQHTLARVLHSNKDACGASCYSWGSHALGQLGLGRMYTGKGRLVPNRVYSLENYGSVLDVAAGGNHSVAVVGQHLVFSWGHAEYGQHGNTYGEGRDYHVDSHHFYEPQRVAGLDEAEITKVACGNHFSVGISQARKKWSWGWNGHGVLGRGPGHHDVAPSELSGLGGASGRAVAVAAAYDHCAVIMEVQEHTTFPVLSSMVDNATLSDVQFVLSKDPRRIFYAHRAIILARCPYLDGYVRASVAAGDFNLTSAPFDDEEASQKCIIALPPDIVDDLDVMQALLSFLYTERFTLTRYKKVRLRKLASTLCLGTLENLCVEDMSYMELQNSGGKLKKGILLSEEIFEHQLDNLLSSGKNADVCIQFDNQLLHCHSSIVCRIDFFRGLLLGGFREGQLNTSGLRQIDLSNLVNEGFGPEAFLVAMRFIYSGSRNLIENMFDPSLIMETIVAAEILGLQQLRNVCEKKLCNFVLDSLENAQVCLEFAQRYGLERLSSQCQQVLIDEAAGSSTEKAPAPLALRQISVDPNVWMLCELGFSESVAQDCLQKHQGDANAAANELLSSQT